MFPFHILARSVNETCKKRDTQIVAYTLIWYGRQGIVEKVSFDAEKAARDHALANFPLRNQQGIVAVEVRKDDGTVVFSQAGGK